jgi:C4-dicarboxylate transporter DctM subunit
VRGLIEKWDKWERRAAAILMAISVSLAFYEVLSRFIFHTSIDWSSEITIISIIFCAILAISTLIKQDENVGVDLFLINLSKKRQDILHFLNGILCLVFTIIFAYSGFLQVHDSYTKLYISETTLKIPLWMPHALMPFGGVLFSCRMIERLYSLVTRINLKDLFKDPVSIVYILFCLALIFFLKMGYSPTVILIFGLLGFLFFGMPIAFALGVVCLAVLYFFGMVPMVGFASKMYESMNTFSFLAIPFFILSGNFMTRGGIARPLLDFAFEILKPIAGGFAIAVMVACIIFAALSGASVAIAAAIGIMALPIMMEKGYPRRLGLGLISTGGTLGSLIPPSGILILYGAVSGESIGDLFKGGIVPGLIIGIAFCFYIYFFCKAKGYGLTDSEGSISIRNIAKTFFNAFWALLMPFIILGGIYSGIFTPTEAAAVAVFYAIFICSLTYEKMKLREYLPILEESAKFTGVIYFIVMTATLFGFLVTMEQLSNKILGFLIDMNIQTWLFLLIINLSVFIMGFFLHPGAIILMAVPMLYPILSEMNINPIHFGVLLAINSELGFATPPFGMNLFVVSSVCRVPVMEVARGEIPFILILLIALLVITYFPIVSLVFVQ